MQKRTLLATGGVGSVTGGDGNVFFVYFLVSSKEGHSTEPASANGAAASGVTACCQGNV